MRFPTSILSIFLFFLAFISVSNAFAVPQKDSDISPAEDQQLDSTHLVKRGCVPSQPLDICEDMPTVDFLVEKIQHHGKVGKLDSLFYSGLGGGGAIEKATKWYKANVPKGRGSVAFDDIVNKKWCDAQGMKLVQQSNALMDPFQKRLSQAFAEASTGTVYFFTKPEDPNKQKDNEPKPISTWEGWEFPALTRNQNVEKIIQVNPLAAGDKGHVIWKKGDGPSAHPPRG